MANNEIDKALDVLSAALLNEYPTVTVGLTALLPAWGVVMSPRLRSLGGSFRPQGTFGTLLKNKPIPRARQLPWYAKRRVFPALGRITNKGVAG